MVSSVLRRRLVVIVVGSANDIVGPTRCQGATSCISTDSPSAHYLVFDDCAPFAWLSESKSRLITNRVREPRRDVNSTGSYPGSEPLLLRTPGPLSWN